MPNQREIAALLGITQASVSMALRGDRKISTEMRRRVRETAERLGYHSNAYVNVLMSHIRSGKKLNDKGVIALLVDTRSQKDWYGVESYRVFHQGVIRRGVELGFHVESFFLREPNMSISKMERILHTRGIQGMILAPPYRGNRTLNLRWDRYAAVGVGFGWERQELDRVVYDNLQNFITAFHELQRLGYRRIGTVLGKAFTEGDRCGTKWYTGYLECQDQVPRECRIPVFAGDNLPRESRIPEFAGAHGNSDVHIFRKWLKKWQPDVLLTLTGKEREWLNTMGLRIPEDIGLACLSQPTATNYAGVDEKGDEVGAAALELVAAKIARNEYGPPFHPKVTMIEGRWVDGATVQASLK